MSKLYIVPTPIGNLKDITFRAIETLKEVDLILAEDTRTSGKLLNHYEIKTPMTSYHMHNEHRVLGSVIEKLQSGINIALISDAGTPAISDPGFLLIRECVDNQIEVDCLPGATALIPALVNSGFPNDKFIFEGFLPVKKGRQTRFKKLADEQKVDIKYFNIIYEAIDHVEKSLSGLLEPDIKETVLGSCDTLEAADKKIN